MNFLIQYQIITLSNDFISLIILEIIKIIYYIIMLYFFLIFCLILLQVYFENYRNDIYGAFYNSIQDKDVSVFINLIHCFLLITIAHCVIDYAIDIVKFLYKIYKKQQIQFYKNSYNKDLSLIFFEEQEKIADNCISFYSTLFQGIIKVILIVKIFYITKISFFTIFLVLFSSLFNILFNIFFLTTYINKLTNDYIFQNNFIRKFLINIYSPNSIFPLKDIYNIFSKDTFEKEKKYYYWLTFKAQMNNFIENSFMFVPFMIFIPYYLNNSINYGQFSQLVNLFVIFNFGIKKIQESTRLYILYKESLKRFAYKESLNILNGEKIIIKNISLTIKDKNIFENFSISFEEKKNNLVGRNSIGKSSLFKCMRGFYKFEGEIILPKDIVFIPEFPNIPNDYIICKSQKFIDNCKIFDINPDIIFSKASGSEKWKLIAAFSLQSEFIVWDDPLWGVENEENIQKLIENSTNLLILSAKKIESSKIKHIFI